MPPFETGPSDERLWLWLELLPHRKSLATTIGTSAVLTGMRCSHVRKLLGLGKSWVSDQVLVVIATTLVSRRSTAGRIANTLGINKKRFLSVAKSLGLLYRNKRPTRGEVHKAMLLVIENDYSFRGAAEASGISRSALHRYVQKHRVRLSDRVSTEIKIRPVSWRCPIHGPLTVMPCIACAAQASKRLQLTAVG